MTDHHAVLFVGEEALALKELDGVCPRAHVDVEFIRSVRFSISDARLLKERASNKPVELSKRHFIISAENLEREAQHALLKLFEDPPPGVQFFVIVKDDRVLLPTLRSRFHTVVLKTEREHETKLAEQFLALSYSERLQEIATRMNEKDAIWGEDLICSLGTLLQRDIGNEKSAAAIDALLSVERHYSFRGASKKMLLEHLALSLP